MLGIWNVCTSMCGYRSFDWLPYPSTWCSRTTSPAYLYMSCASRKPTLERGSQDGGLCFTVEDSVEGGAGGDLPAGPTLIMRRISEGQEIRKVTDGKGGVDYSSTYSEPDVVLLREEWFTCRTFCGTAVGWFQV